MKKNFKKLVLNKSTLSNLDNQKIIGGGTNLTTNNTIDLSACNWCSELYSACCPTKLPIKTCIKVDKGDFSKVKADCTPNTSPKSAICPQ